MKCLKRLIFILVLTVAFISCSDQFGEIKPDTTAEASTPDGTGGVDGGGSNEEEEFPD
ncbi:MAG: hypothetical protein AAFX87_19445 [Bacteroidota bacterium]